MDELSTWIAKHDLKQADAAEVLMVSRPHVSDVVTAKFTIDTLVEMLSRVGKPVRLSIG
jgi:predicted XRE-type DNA-binding protein